ncbi:Na(+)/H(+) antiporter [Paucilactobacillus hokkaidonensis JCM 18461]|uniref:Na(+)/H(+) antiporter n=2 Tax=Paucilactobacillus hokkaidonensis TaxID=1193095 RepID=A0A0A1GZ36_9LACO|nr:cation:proton antiporter [Paucilactobacillus hokkaidonensis]KRO10247.1 napA3 protein [Paucilactobacillus hokkaidonensis]BAP86264.1 Na(+)/H(+) antiporter [Paucilactobacillus hokkaidonensis JCM 18461]
MHAIGELCLILIATTIAGHYSARIGLPAVVGQLLVGILVGPAIFDWIKGDEFTSLFSEIGVIILMFSAGMESDLNLLKKYLKPSILVALLGVILPVITIYGLSLAFHLHQTESIFIGVIFAATSVSISVAVLKELDVLHGKAGATILGAAVVDDVLAVVILSVMVSLIGTGASTGGSSNLLLSFTSQIIFFIAIYFVVKFIAPILARLGKHLFIPGGPTIVAVILCLGMALIADAIDLSSVVGAFFAGIAISQTSVKHEVEQNIEPIGYAMFIPVFFVSIGLSMSFDGFMDDFLFIVLLTILATITKLLGAGLGAKLSNFSMKDSYIVGAGMVSRGEMALIIAQIGYRAELLSSEYYSAIITAIILTTLIAPLLLKHAYSLKEN